MNQRHMPVFALLVAICSSAAAGSRIELNSSIGASSPVYIDPIGLREMASELDAGSTLVAGQAVTGGLKALAKVDARTNQTFINASSRVVWQDVLTVNAGDQYALQAGFVVLQVDYGWTSSRELRGAGDVLTGGSTSGDVRITVGGNGAYARSTTFSGSAFEGSTSVVTPFEALGEGAVEISAVGGRYVQLRLPIVFGQATSLEMELSVGSTALNGTATIDASNSAYWAGLTALDSALRPIEFAAVGVSGLDYAQSYTPAVPEPSQWLLFCMGGAALVGMRWRPATR